MNKIRSCLAYETASNAIVRLYKIFNYVFGSNSEGLITIILTRLNMTDQQCIDIFQNHIENTFLAQKPLYKIFGPLFTTKYNSKNII